MFNKKTMVCHAFIIDILWQKFMLHIWLKPRFEISFHKKNTPMDKRLFWIEKY